jgi:hypothetical protein
VQSYRAHIAADPSNGVTENHSAAVQIKIAGTAAKPTTPSKPTTPAGGAVQFTRIQYDVPGAATGSNSSLNAEWFRLTNKTSTSVSLKGWTVRDAGGNVYSFPTYLLGAGRNVVVRTGKGTAGQPVDTRYWGSTKYIWNNAGDTATLRDSASKTIDTCTWASDKDYTNC